MISPSSCVASATSGQGGTSEPSSGCPNATPRIGPRLAAAEPGHTRAPRPNAPPPERTRDDDSANEPSNGTSPVDTSAGRNGWNENATAEDIPS
jgi:hypothetical protein